ncbi:hypothetical protein [Actinokineospora sp. UTMC 2448]|uniref:hypothetical protein n=1 Tax=Actinokineospora sp. UTMC 2448 TaxID=2268449 RepID=UPI00216468F1|nr:hypothetical protein [Actinokineospora sp. UTMC 2448]UVS81630.1 hypothetical protein Actkin_05392 [Actinokineospora sp. UTMC 2448]
MTSPRESFETDLAQLGMVGGWSLPYLAHLLEQEAGRYGSYEGLGAPGGYAGLAESDFWDLTGELRDRNRRAIEVVTATAEALRDVVSLYGRADGQG